LFELCLFLREPEVFHCPLRRVCFAFQKFFESVDVGLDDATHFKLLSAFTSGSRRDDRGRIARPLDRHAPERVLRDGDSGRGAFGDPFAQRPDR